MPYNDKGEVLRRAREALRTTQEAMADTRDPRRRLAALRNIVVFGRSVTNIIENLRSRVERFDEWYKPLSEAMARDPVLKFFYTMRSEILKQGAMNVAREIRGEMRIAAAEVEKLPKPRNAKGFFVGDEAGGSGWEVEVAPGVIERYYVDLPESWGVNLVLSFPDAPAENKDAIALCKRYLEHMERIVRAAEERWG